MLSSATTAVPAPTFAGLPQWRYATLRAELERSGLPIGALDTQIAAHALALGCTLVTNNTREFARIGGLALENWAEPLLHEPLAPYLSTT